MRAENLQEISLIYCNIGPSDILALTTANWTKLSIINLCNLRVKK
jgi:hypothetical protein